MNGVTFAGVITGVVSTIVLGITLARVTSPNSSQTTPDQTVIIVTPTPEHMIIPSPIAEDDLKQIKGDVVWFLSYDSEETTVYRWFELKLQLACVQTYHKYLAPEYRWDSPSCVPVKELPEDIQADVAALTLRWKGILP